MSMCADCVSGALRASASMSPCRPVTLSFAGVVHEGTPTGKLEVIGGVECYTATPEGDYAKDKVVLYLCDAMGLSLVNNKLLVDSFAQNGFKTVMMDYLNGDAVPVDYLMQEGGFDIPAWVARHGLEVTRPSLDKVIAALKEQGVKDFGAMGYRFGGRYVFELAFDGIIKVGMTAHPSMLTFPDDFEKYVSTASAPLQINSAELDEYLPPEIHAKVDEIFANAKFAPGYETLL
ncbi:hypothetical protein BDZ89DRAFT_1077074 [Hymenopellis radicata]|nr:hypothetical protein BDZ89DRAFT_1077074 [Hymenopellis radicata]